MECRRKGDGEDELRGQKERRSAQMNTKRLAKRNKIKLRDKMKVCVSERGWRQRRKAEAERGL